MGQALTKEELVTLKPHLEGFDPSCLATIIWDSIQEISQDYKDEGFGIHFGTGLEEQEWNDDQQTVTFWDNENGVQQLPRKVFLEILQFIGESTIKEWDNNNREGEAVIEDKGLSRLKLAMERLKAKLLTLQKEEGAIQYRWRTETGLQGEVCKTKNYASNPPDSRLLEKIRVKNVSYSWVNSTDEEDEVFVTPGGSMEEAERGPPSVVVLTPPVTRKKSSNQLMTSSAHNSSSNLNTINPKLRGSTGSMETKSIETKGMGALVARLPELRSRYEKQMSVSNEGYLNEIGLKQRMKDRVLSMFGHSSSDELPQPNDEPPMLPTIAETRSLEHGSSTESTSAEIVIPTVASRKKRWRVAKHSSIHATVSESIGDVQAMPTFIKTQSVDYPYH